MTGPELSRDEWVSNALADYMRLKALLNRHGVERWEDTVSAVEELVDRQSSEANCARDALYAVLAPFVFKADGTVDHDPTLAKVAEEAAAKILHLRKLHNEMVGVAEKRGIRIAELEEALRPFAETTWYVTMRHPLAVPDIGKEPFRRAAEVLKGDAK